ncbi:Uncharacterized protein YP598_0624 [Yersinia pseudotuberculosis]|nr:Uncharacterized protein YP598_0624 [Yersinia pseudotuberculosis]
MCNSARNCAVYDRPQLITQAIDSLSFKLLEEFLVVALPY